MPTPQQSPVLAVQNVTKAFGTFKAVDNVTIEVMPGEIFGFLGPNGAGKSTTIRLILDILRPSSGTIALLGRPNQDVKSVHRDIGFLSGDMVVDTDLTGRQYLSFLNNIHGGGHGEAIQRLAGILEADLSKKIGTYSRGNRQKIGLIAALLHNPKLLVLDEPTSGFDPLVQEKFADLIREYVSSGGSVFMSSHILAEVQHLCDRVAFIKEGKIISTTSVQQLVNTTAKRVHITASEQEIRKIQSDYKTVPSLELVEAGSSFLDFSYNGNVQPLLQYFGRKNITDITIREPELEEIFGEYYETSPTPKEADNA